MTTRGIRGATTVAANDRLEILARTRELLETMVRLNGLRSEDIASVWFTVTDDLDAEFPAFAARELGWSDVPLMCGREIPVAGALPRCIRVLITWNTAKGQSEIRHAFLHGARALRPAWAVEP
ncbi:MAG TPA: chorismate mutase [Candidatus Limnocylindria bacterium]|jgi:chorismate mutase